MKKIIVIILLLFISIPNIKASTDTASSYVLMDLDSGRVLSEKNMHSQKLIASITKIMTCIIAIENEDINSLSMTNDNLIEKVEQLEKMGLRVPQITKIMIALKEKGYDISDGILTVEQAFYQLVDLLKKEGKL